MKVLSIEEAQGQFAAVCEEVLAGEIVRFKLANGAVLELTPVLAAPRPIALSDEQLARCYDDPDWAAFENRCAKACD